MTFKEWAQSKFLAVRVWVNKVVGTTFNSAHAFYDKCLTAVINEFSSFRRIVVTIFITIVLGDIVLKGKLGVIPFIITLLKDVKDIVIATGLLGIAGIILIIIAVLLKDKKVI